MDFDLNFAKNDTKMRGFAGAIWSFVARSPVTAVRIRHATAID
jgi:hypothetical protein